MELINNRYRTIKRTAQEELASIYLVEDLWDKNKKLQLNLLHSRNVTPAVIDYFSAEFIRISSLKNNYILGDFHFNRLTHVNNRRKQDIEYFYANEYIKNLDSLSIHWDDMTFDQLIKIFIDVCRGITYLHIKGHAYEGITIENIMYNPITETVKLKSVATVRIETQLKHKECSEVQSLGLSQTPSELDISIKTDLYDLGVLLLSLLTRKDITLFPARELSNLEVQLTDRPSDLPKLLPIIRELLKEPANILFENVQDIVAQLNKALHTNYHVIEPHLFERLNFHTKLINQEEVFSKIDATIESISRYEISKKSMLLSGSIGAGKTRILQEIEFLYNLKGIDVYSAFTLDNSNGNNSRFWTGMLRKLMMDCDIKVYDEYEADLKVIFPELADKHTVKDEIIPMHKTKHHIVKRIASFVRDSIQDRFTMFLIDNIQLASDFTLKLLLEISDVLQKENTIFILSYNDTELNSSAYFRSFIRGLIRRNEGLHMEVESLTEEETAELIKEALSISYMPVKLARRMYSITDGNPLFINEKLKSFRNRKIIYVNDSTGEWMINLPEVGNYNSIQLPSSLAQVMNDQVEELDSKSRAALEKIAIYTSPKPLEFWKEVLEISLEETVDILQSLINQSILRTVIDDATALYGFKSKMLQRIFNGLLAAEIKQEEYGKAALLLEKQGDIRLYDEMIDHFEQANQPDKVKYYALKNADEMRRMNDINSMFANLKKALIYVQDNQEKIDVLIEIGDKYLERDDKDTAYIYFKQAEDMLEGSDDKALIVALYLRLVEIEIYFVELDVASKYLKQVKEILATKSCAHSKLVFKRVSALYAAYTGELEESKALCLEIIAQAADEVLIAGAKQQLARTYTYVGNKTEEAIELYEAAIAVFERKGYIRELIYCSNGLASIYLEQLHELDIAFDKFTALNELSSEYNYVTGTVLSLISIGVIQAVRGDFQEALTSYRVALEKMSEAKGIKDKKPFLYNNLIRVSLDLNQYDLAEYYFLAFEKDFKQNKYPEIHKVQQYLAYAMFYFAQGMYDEANVYDQLVLDSGMDKRNLTRLYANFRTNVYKLRMKPIGEGKKEFLRILELIKLFHKPDYCLAVLVDFGMMLYNSKDVENIKRVNKIIEEEMLEVPEPTARIKARYYFLRGIVTTNDSREEELLLSLDFAKKELEFTAKIMMELGEGYVRLGHFYLAANYFLESGSISKPIINRVPDKYKLVYVNAKEFAITFYRVSELTEVIIRKSKLDISSAEPIKQVHSLKELGRILQDFNVDTFVEDEHFMDITQRDYRRHISFEYMDMESVVANLSSDTLENIEALLTHLIANTITDSGYVAVEAQNKSCCEVLASVYTGEIEIDQQVLQRVKASGEPVSINMEQKARRAILEGVKQALYIPIFENDYYVKMQEKKTSEHVRDYNHHIIGYLCLESDKIINNLTIEAVHTEMSLLNLLALLIEKQQLQVAASIDKITGALTRKYLEDSLVEHLSMANYTEKPFSIIMCDIDRFKRINDTYGHLTGDNVLTKLSGLIMTELGDRGILGRYGGEEFIVILSDTDLVQALGISEMLREKISEARFLNNDTVITISLGVVSSEQATTMDDIIGKADQALYVAKETGRNKSICWDDKYRNYMQKTNHLTEIITGDEVQDSRVILALVELVEMSNKNISREEKIHEFIGRTIEVVDAQKGCLFRVKNGKVFSEHNRNILQTEQVKKLIYNKELLESTIVNGEANYLVNWEDTEIASINVGLPEWQSNLVIPIKYRDTLLGVIYLVASARVKEFGMKELNVVNVLSNIAATILREHE